MGLRPPTQLLLLAYRTTRIINFNLLRRRQQAQEGHSCFGLFLDQVALRSSLQRTCCMPSHVHRAVTVMDAALLLLLFLLLFLLLVHATQAGLGSIAQSPLLP